MTYMSDSGDMSHMDPAPRWGRLPGPCQSDQADWAAMKRSI